MEKEIKQRINIGVQLIAYYITWTVCILLAAKSYAWWGLILSIQFLAGQLIWYRYTHRSFYPLWPFGVIFALIGLFVDSLLYTFNIFQFMANPFPITIAPPFLWAIWLSFSILLYGILQVWFKRYFVLGILSFIGFPSAYWLGATFGAASATLGLYSYLILGLIWGTMIPLFLFLQNKFRKHR